MCVLCRGARRSREHKITRFFLFFFSSPKSAGRGLQSAEPARLCLSWRAALGDAMYGGDEVGALVIDVGTTYTKAGYAGEDLPKLVLPTAVGVRTAEAAEGAASGAAAMDVDDGDDSKSGKSEAKAKLDSAGAVPRREYFVGEQSLKYRRDRTEIVRPLEDGVVRDWDAMDKVWDYVFKKHLGVNLSEFPLLVSEPTLNPPENRERMVERIFEQHQCPATFLAKDAVLATFATGRSVALVLDVGGGVMKTAPVHDGYVLNKGVRKTRMAGEMVDLTLEKLLFRDKDRPRDKDWPNELVPLYRLDKQLVNGKYVSRKVNFPGTSDSFHRFMCMDIVRDIKETLGKMPIESKFDRKSYESIPRVPYELPDGQILQVGSERFEASDVLFNMPKGFKRNVDIGSYKFRGAHHMVAESINSCEPDIRRDLFLNIIITGGASNIPGLNERLMSELKSSIPSSFTVRNVSGSGKTEKSYGAWVGGSILGSLGTFHQMWLSKAEYEEHGTNLLRRKCP